MCTVDKMLIKGIRSFSPENTTPIEFYKPLTLIVGSNGAGKTTVIECLKQACTGELPPNTRSGQSFIHDPKVAGENEVKAQIKLRFKTSTGNPVVVLRSFQLLQKKTTMQFKTLDSTLQTIDANTGRKEATTYRCADIDKMVPSLMGVSKAVLENVIFVHQEDSNWPLAEGRVLKEKFDDIFAATKYTKALDALRKMRTEKVHEVKVMHADLEALRAHRDQALRLKKTKTDEQAKAQAIEEAIRDAEAQMNIKHNEAMEFDRRLTAIMAVCESLQPLRAKHEVLVRQTQEYLNKLPNGQDMEETDAELEDWCSKFESECREQRTKVEDMQRQMNNRRIEKESISDKYQRDCMTHGRLSAEATAHTSHTSELQRFMGHCSALLGLPPPPPLPQGAGGAAVAAAASFRSQVEAKRAAVEASVREVKALNRSKDSALGEEIDRVGSSLSRSVENVRLKKEQLTKNERAMQALEDEISMLLVNMGVINDAHERVAVAEGRLKAKQAEVARSGCEEVLLQERAAIEQIQARIAVLRQERERLVFLSDSTTKLRLKRQELACKEEALSAFLTRWRPKLLLLLRAGPGAQLPPESRLKEEAEHALAARRAELASKGKELQDAQGQQAAAQGALGSTRSQLFQVETQLQQMRTQMRAAMQAAVEGSLEEDAYEGKMSTIKKEFESMGERVASARGMLKVLQDNQRQLEAGDCCPTCRRGFASLAEKQQILATVAEEIQMLPGRLAHTAAELERHKRQVDALQALQPQWLKIRDLSLEVPTLKQRLTTQEARVGELASRVSELQEEYAMMETEVQEAGRTIAEAAWQVDRQWRELEEMRRSVGSLDASLGPSQSLAASGRTVADVDQQLEGEEQQKGVHERTLEETMRKQARLKDDLLALTADVADAKAECTRATESYTKRKDLEAKLQQMAKENAELGTSMEAAQREQQPLQSQREALLRERDAARGAAAQQEADVEAKLREVQQLQDQLQAKLRAVEEYVHKGRAEDLQRATDALAELKRSMESNQQEIQKLESDIAAAQQTLSEMDSIRRDAQDVLEYRRSRGAAQEAEGRVLEEEAKLMQMGDRAELARQHGELLSERDALRSRRDKLQGQLLVTRSRVQEASKELDAPQYNNVEVRFNEKRLTLKTTELANEDLEKYHKALEKALLSYHTSKMCDINKIIKELWQKTYRGQDIDYIQIKADTEGAGARSYNYRVVMYSGGAELEMRGRCSAGQKVLACLIIRLALAETFCLNCGILALDEPTTNLDAANSASLAEALSSIMKARRDQENFQLIVITHDENFARELGTSDTTDYLWRITKDEHQHSKIECEAVGG